MHKGIGISSVENPTLVELQPVYRHKTISGVLRLAKFNFPFLSDLHFIRESPFYINSLSILHDMIM